VQNIIGSHKELFTGIGKFNNSEVNFQIDDQVTPIIQKE